MHSNTKIWLHARRKRCWIWDQAVGHNHTADFKYGKQYFPNLLNYLVCHSDENKRGMSKDERRKGVVRMIELSWRTWGKKDERDLRLCKILLTKNIKPIHLDENNYISHGWSQTTTAHLNDSFEKSSKARTINNTSFLYRSWLFMAGFCAVSILTSCVDVLYEGLL